MGNVMVEEDKYHIKKLDEEELRLKSKYVRWSKLILILSLIYVLWVFFVVISVYFLGMGYNWAFMTMDNWILSSIVLTCFFIILEIVFLFHIQIVRRERREREKPQPMFYRGRKLHVYTYPETAKGGVFSRTYIPIDDDNVLRLRTLIVSAKEIWKRKRID